MFEGGGGREIKGGERMDVGTVGGEQSRIDYMCGCDGRL